MPDLRITLIQTALVWEDKKANLQKLEQKINDLRESTHVIVLPEMFSTGFSMKPESLAEKMDGPTVTWMKTMAASKRVIITGSLIVEDNGQYFNRMIWMLPNGQYGTYDKRHLFAFAGEDLHYTGGSRRLIASVNGWKVNLMVCYDLRFPVWARQQFGERQAFEYDVLLYVANWPQRRSTAWKSLLQARAIENQSYVIGVNRIGEDGNGIYHSGDSMVIDPLGEVLYHKADEEDVFTISLKKEDLEGVRERFPFWKDADEFEILP
ncbi:MAG TPA: amidohydrolase [Flavisolibacter sp.]|nr:amidohydrolase [Flavisolibacter sp.]